MRRMLLTSMTIVAIAGLMAAARLSVPANKVDPSLTAWLGCIHPRVSPDGKMIAVSYQGAIWVVPREGGAMRRLTQGTGFDIEPVWSPDGQRIAFVNSPRFGNGELKVVTVAGKEIPLSHRIEVPGNVLYQKIEWLHDDCTAGALRINNQSLGYGWVNLKSGESKSLVQASTWGRYAVSPDGKWLAYTTTFDQPGQQTGNDGTSAEVWRVSTSGGEPEKLFRFRSRIHDLCWAADGDGLFVVSELGGGQAHNDIWFVPKSDSVARMRKLTFGQADEDRPSVSHDGRWLIFTDNQRGPTSIVARDLHDATDHIVRVEQFEFGQPIGGLKVTVTDQATGKSIVARLSVTKTDGKFAAPPGSLYRVLNDIGHFYCEGSAEWTLPAGQYRVRAFHGPEFQPYSRDIEIAADKSTELSLPMQRWTDPSARGWHSGENHIHANYGYGQWYNSPATMLTQCTGEDLHVCNFMVANSDTDGIFDREFFRGGADPASTEQTLLHWNQEFRSTIWGHMTLVNLKQVVEPVMTGFKDTTNPWDIPTNSDIADKTHWQGGHVNYTHVAQRPDDPYENPYTGKGIPIDVALDKIDSLDLNASYGGTVVLWYRLLNCGFHLPASAGTDVFLNRVVSRLPGGDRVYVQCDGTLTYTKWIDGLRQGRSFVTNGPMLQLSIGTHQIGDAIGLDTAKELPVSLKAESWFPMSKVELIYNGKVISEVPLSDDKRSADLEAKVLLDKSGWLSLRASGPGHADHPVGSLDAHTSPIYVQLKGSPAGAREDAEYFLKWIDRLSLAIRLRERIPNDELRKHVSSQLESARAVYTRISETGR